MKFINSLFSGVSIAVFLLYIAIVLAGIYGYVYNIIKIVWVVTDPSAGITVLLVFRAVGVVAAPLGAILGFF